MAEYDRSVLKLAALASLSGVCQVNWVVPSAVLMCRIDSESLQM